MYSNARGQRCISSKNTDRRNAIKSFFGRSKQSAFNKKNPTTINDELTMQQQILEAFYVSVCFFSARFNSLYC